MMFFWIPVPIPLLIVVVCFGGLAATSRWIDRKNQFSGFMMLPDPMQLVAAGCWLTACVVALVAWAAWALWGCQ